MIIVHTVCFCTAIESMYNTGLWYPTSFHALVSRPGRDGEAKRLRIHRYRFSPFMGEYDPGGPRVKFFFLESEFF